MASRYRWRACRFCRLLSFDSFAGIARFGAPESLRPASCGLVVSNRLFSAVLVCNARLCVFARLRLTGYSLPSVGPIFLAIDRPDRGWVSIEIRASDPEPLLMRIDPLPQLFACGESLHAGIALDAHEISRKPVRIAAAPTPTVIGAISRGLVAACERLTVVVAESARYPWHEPGVIHRAKRVVELQLEAAVHTSDDVVHERHAGALCRCRILPREV